MDELIRTNDPVVLSRITSLLDERSVHWVIFDHNISVMEGSIGAFPKRLMVAKDHLDAARDLVVEAGLGEWIKKP